MTAIQTINLSKKYKDLTALDSLNLKIEEGELFALLGMNGAGKTTLIKLLSCLSSPSSGDAFINGLSVTHERKNVKRILGVSPQETALAPNLSVQENLCLLCDIHKFSKEKTNAKVSEIAEKLKLNDVLHRKAGKLSGGWQRKVNIALALIAEPKILFLDEPTLGLDVTARHDLWDLIRTIKKDSTIILTTHYLEEAESLADRIGILKNGKLIALGTTQELKEKANAQNLETAFVSLIREEEELC
ncbi:MAG: ABC transporter ATP-binding protein [Clostridia bacterium]|nr:ABC transporter ATP-binding protein [Clostridia bacterium]